MPELPEVETYARDLDGALRGRTFVGAVVGWPRQVPLMAPESFGRAIAGRTVRSVRRRGKYLVMDLDGLALLVHLKMSGRFVLASAADEPDPHAHLVLGLADGSELRLHDPRKFGRAWLLDRPERVLGGLGPEPLDADLTPDRFARRLAGRRGRLKPLLLDQRFLAGLGNIYVDESLWLARLHPATRADRVGRRSAIGLLEAIRSVLRAALAARGCTLADGGHLDLTGNPGEMQGSLAVYGRSGAPCPRCDTPIRRIVLGGCGTHFCPRCQRRRA